MTRRLLLIAIALCCATASIDALPQQPSRTPMVGVVAFAVGSDDPAIEAFRQRLRELGYVEGRTIRFTFRSAHGDAERLPAIAEELVRLKADVIVVGNPLSARAMMRATSDIPIVIALSDPLASGLVTNLARPGGNVTGLSTMSTELHGKRLQLLKEAIPGLTRIAVLWYPMSSRTTEIVEDLKRAASALSIEVMAVSTETPAEFSPAFAGVSRGRVQAVYLVGSPLFYAHRAALAALALKARLPAIYETKAFVTDGGFMSYGVDYADQTRRMANYVDRILKGAKPGDLPIEQATKLELVINIKTAKSLGVTIPQSILSQADELIR